MEMIGRPLENITYPIYPIRTYEKMTEAFGVVKVYSRGKMYILDDRNLEGKTLGERRLRLSNSKYKLRTSVCRAKDVILSPNKVFIDDEGVVFKYIKTRTARLVYRQVSELIRLPTGGTKVLVRGVNTPFIMTQEVDSSFAYAGVLQVDGGYILYEVAKKKKEDTWRKV